MEHESMVHALSEIRRVLKPNGMLLDLRPVEANWSVEIVSSAGWQAAGRLSDLPVAVEDDEAAFRAMREAQSKGWYIKKEEKEFPAGNTASPRRITAARRTMFCPSFDF